MKEVIVPIKMVCNNCEEITQGDIEITLVEQVDDYGRFKIKIEGEIVCQECNFSQEFREANFVFNTVILEEEDDD